MNFFPVQHSTLDENSLATWVGSLYSLDAPVTCQFIRQSMSDVYWIQSRSAAYVLKVYLRHRHSRGEIEEEVHFLKDLLAHAIAVAAPAADRDGNFIQEIPAAEGTRYAVLFEAVQGNQPQEKNLAHSRSFGRLAAQVHNCADQLDQKYARRNLDTAYWIEEPLGYIRPFLQHRIQDFNDLCAIAADLSAELGRLASKEKPAYGLCHGDLHTGNARFDINGRLTLFDFDSFGYGWRAIDIGVYHVSYNWMSLSQKTQREKERFWEAFLEGYTGERPLSEKELELAQLCLPIRHLELMHITMRYWSPQIGSGWINDDYFDEHIAWFKQWAKVYHR